MTTPNPEHLFEQALSLAAVPTTGRPRQANLRRSISAAYYGVFHATLSAAADQFVGRARQSSKIYVLVYRSIDHGKLRELCEEIKKTPLPEKFKSYAPSGGFGDEIRGFSVAFLELQEKRHSADYDPSYRVKMSDVVPAIKSARDAVERLQRAPSEQREAFLGMLLFKPR